MYVERVTRVDADLVSAFARLIPQLSSAGPPTEAELAEIIAAPNTHLLAARDDRAISGILTLTLYRIPTGLQARIDDAVVDASARGHGTGEALTQEAIRIAREAGARSIHLTSHPSREAANRLYARLGFVRRDTNVYHLELGIP